MTTKEEIPVGTVIGTLEAIDEDIGDNAAVDYAITGKTDCDFNIVNLSLSLKTVTKTS